jgi:hypothetical protein
MTGIAEGSRPDGNNSAQPSDDEEAAERPELIAGRLRSLQNFSLSEWCCELLEQSPRLWLQQRFQ